MGFQVQALHHGLERIPGCAVAWSLKSDQQAYLPGGSVQNLPTRFFIQTWLPQGEALHLRDVALVVTHCGWGGLNEAIAAGKPIIATPFRVDQPTNAAIAKARGFCEVLDPRSLCAGAVEGAVKKMLGEESYVRCAQNLQTALAKTGGVETCVDAVERL